jgi:uncharacterized protein (DUF362 family)
MSRRRFLGLCGSAGSSLMLASCAAPASSVDAAATPGLNLNTAALKAERPKVAIAQAHSYDRAVVRKQVRQMIDQLGGLKRVVRSRDRVVIKTNLTGGVRSGSLPGLSPIDTFITHPEVVRALVEIVKEAGARDVTIVESVYEWASFVEWGYEAIADELAVTLLDLNQTAPYKGYVKKSSGRDPLLYDAFTFNPILEECDVFMSVAKMKCHATAGITLSMKNLVGLVPASFYRLTDTHSHRSELHGPGDEGYTRIPRAIVDLNRARPIHFALIDGIKSVNGGEGPWLRTLRANTPNLLVAGDSALATDTVASSLMGFDAAAPAHSGAFARCDNHFALAAARGLGTNQIAGIDVSGPPLRDVTVKFRPA